MSDKSTNVETNVVQMRFDNKNFEKNVGQTMSTLDKLKKNLNFDDTNKSFKQLEENTKRVDFSPMEKGIEKVRYAFSFLDRFSMQVYDRLSNRLINIGEKIVSSVSTEGIKSGFNEYELKMNSFKTIQASAGKDFTDSQINEYLEELNKYADKTIYSFSDMTNNIGKFTNAGVKLDVAVKAIQGISNEAAVSGANAQEASRAMYNFSQALSAGYVKLIDWKSIENANMATEEFKTQLLETAKELNKVTKAADGTYRTVGKGTLVTATRNFNETLSEQWMTTEVLTKTLEKYADTTTEIGKKAFEAAQKVNTFSKLIDTLKEAIQSGWSQTWELLLGNLKEATALWTSISDKIGGVIDAFFAEKKAVLESWKANKGRERTIAALKTTMKNLGRIITTVKEAWRDIFPKATAQTIMKITRYFEALAKKTKTTDYQLQPLKRTLRGIFSVLAILKEGLTAFRKVFGSLFGKLFKDAAHSIFGVSGGLGQMLVKVKNNIINNKTFYKTFESIAEVLEKVYWKLKKVVSAIWSFAKTFASAINASGGLKAFTGWLTSMGNAIKNFDIKAMFNGIIKAFKTFGKILDKTLTNTFDFYTPLKEKILEAKNKIINNKVVETVVDIFKSMVNGIQKVFDSFRGIKTDGVDEFSEKTKKKFSFLDTLVKVLKTIFEGIKKALTAIWNLIKPVVKFIGNVIKSIFNEILGIIRRSDLGDVGAFIAGGGFGALLFSIKDFFSGLGKLGNLGSTLKLDVMFSKITTVLSDASKMLKVKTLKEIATAILMLAGAMLILAMIPEDKMAVAIASIIALFKGLTSAVASLSKSSATTKVTSAVGITTMILAIASAVVLLSSALAVLSFINYENSTKALMVMSLILTMLVTSVNSLAGIAAKGKSSALTLIGISVLVATLASAITMLTIPIMAFSLIIAKSKGGASNLLKATGILVTILAAISGIVIALTKLVSKLSIKDVIKVASVLIVFGTVFKKLATSLALIMGVIGVMAVLISKGAINSDGLEKAGEMFVAILAVLTGVIIALSEISKQINTGELMKISALIGVISIMVSILTGIFAVLAIIPEKAVDKAIVALGAITTAMITILAAFAVIAKLNIFSNMGFTDIIKMMLMMAAIMVPFTAAITVLLLGLSVFIKALEKSSIDENTIKTAILMVASMIAAIAASMVILAGVAKNISMKDVTKLTLLVAAITALMSTLTLIVLAMSTLRGETLGNGAKGLMAMAAALVLIFAAMRIMVASADKNKVGLTNGVKSIILISLAMSALTGVLSALVFLGEKKGFDKGLTALLKISAAIVAVTYIAGKSKAMAAGLKAISTTMAMLGVAAAGFAAFVLAIVKAFTLLKDMTEDDLDKMAGKIERFADAFKKSLGRLSEIAGEAVAFIVRAIINAVLTTLSAFGKELLTGLINLVDILIDQAPTLVNKALELLVVVLSAVERSLAPVVATALKVAISFVDALANGIRDNSDRILDAISNLIDAAAGLVAKAVTRVLGIKEWEAGFKVLKTIIKNFGALILTIFVVNKLKAQANAATGIIAAFATKVKTFVATLKTDGFGSAWSELFGIDKLNVAWAQASAELSTGKMILSRGLTLLKGAITGAGIGLALGSLVKSFIDAKADAIDTTTGMAGDIEVIYKDLADKTKKTFEELKTKRKEFIAEYSDKTEVYNEINAYKQTLEKLVKADGTILKGHETEVKNIVDAINDKLGDRLAIEGNILKSLNDQGEAQKYSSDMLDKIIEKERMKADLEVASEENKENIKLKRELNEELQGWTTEQVEKDKETAQQFIDALKSGDIKSITNDKTFRDLASKYNFDYSGLETADKQKEAAERLKAAMNVTQDSIEAQRNTILTKISEVNGRMELYQLAQEAALKENTEAYNKYMALLETGVSPTANTGSKKQQAISQARSISNMMENFEEGSYTKDDVKKAILSFNELVGALEREGQSLGNITGLSFDKTSMSYDEFVKTAADKFAKLPEAMKYATEGVSDEANELGKTKVGIPLADGVLEGQTEKIASDGKKVAEKNVSALVGDWRYASDSHSPSRVFKREVGEPIGEGVLVGIADALSKSNVDDSVSGLIELLQSSVLPGIAGLTGNSSMFGSLFPVNFGGIQNGSGLSGTANAPALSFAAPMPYQASLDTINTNLSKLTDRMVEQTNSITNEIKGLRTDVTDLGTRIDGLEVMLDGDALVGRLTPRINNSLVTYANRVGRGV